jgi:plastocyanin/streptogramin lyase
MKTGCGPLVLAVTVAAVLAAEPGQAAVIEVQVDSNVFTPEFVIINRGDTVRWVWVNGIHSTTAYDGSWDSGLLGPDSQLTYTFTGTGQFDYYCSIHVDCCNMRGTVYVLDTGPPRNVVVTAYKDNAILLQAADGTPLDPLVPPSGSSEVVGPAGITVGPDGLLYVSNQVSVFQPGADDSVVQVDPATGAVTPFIDLPSGYAPAGLCFGRDRNLYVCRHGGPRARPGTGAVDCFSGTTGAFLGTVVTDLTQPSGLIVDVVGNLYVSSTGDGSIVRFDGTRQQTLVAAGSGGLAGPSGLEIGPLGILYVADRSAGAVRTYDLMTGESLGDFIPPGGALVGQLPSDLLFDDDGNLLVANLGNSFWTPTGAVKAFDARSGEYLGDFATGIFGAAQLALIPSQ